MTSNNFNNLDLLKTVTTEVALLRRSAIKIPHRHRILVTEMLSWPQPFCMTDQRQKIINSQQFNQKIMDMIMTDLENILAELNKLFITAPIRPFRQ